MPTTLPPQTKPMSPGMAFFRSLVDPRNSDARGRPYILAPFVAALDPATRARLAQEDATSLDANRFAQIKSALGSQIASPQADAQESAAHAARMLSEQRMNLIPSETELGLAQNFFGKEDISMRHRLLPKQELSLGVGYDLDTTRNRATMDNIPYVANTERQTAITRGAQAEGDRRVIDSTVNRINAENILGRGTAEGRMSNLPWETQANKDAFVLSSLVSQSGGRRLPSLENSEIANNRWRETMANAGIELQPGITSRAKAENRFGESLAASNERRIPSSEGMDIANNKWREEMARAGITLQPGITRRTELQNQLASMQALADQDNVIPISEAQGNMARVSSARANAELNARERYRQGNYTVDGLGGVVPIQAPEDLGMFLPLIQANDTYTIDGQTIPGRMFDNVMQWKTLKGAEGYRKDMIEAQNLDSLLRAGAQSGGSAIPDAIAPYVDSLVPSLAPYAKDFRGRQAEEAARKKLAQSIAADRIRESAAARSTKAPPTPRPAAQPPAPQAPPPSAPPPPPSAATQTPYKSIAQGAMDLTPEEQARAAAQAARARAMAADLAKKTGLGILQALEILTAPIRAWDQNAARRRAEDEARKQGR